MGAVVLDAGVVIGILEIDDPHHEASEAALRRYRDEDLRLPASAYAEALVRPAHRGAADLAIAAIGEFALRIDPIERASAETAAAIRARHRSLRLPDALVLGYAEVIDADVVLTTDRRWKRVSDRVHVV